MNGVMIPVASAGSNQVGASETCTAQVNSPFGSAPSAGAPATRPNADSSSSWRRLIVVALLYDPDSVQSLGAVMTWSSHWPRLWRGLSANVADPGINVPDVLIEAKWDCRAIRGQAVRRRLWG